MFFNKYKIFSLLLSRAHKMFPEIIHYLRVIYVADPFDPTHQMGSPLRATRMLCLPSPRPWFRVGIRTRS